jgi:hypothetical protein
MDSDMPDLASLSRTSLFDRLLNPSFGMGAYSEPTQFQLTTATRLLDKALEDWEHARREFADYAGRRAGIPQELHPSREGVTRALFRAIGSLENLVDSLARLLRLVDALEQAPELQQVSSTPLPRETERELVRRFRNRIAHGDEDIADGKAAQGMATATLRPDMSGIELQGQRLNYADVERMLRRLHGYLRAAAEKT